MYSNIFHSFLIYSISFFKMLVANRQIDFITHEWVRTWRLKNTVVPPTLMVHDSGVLFLQHILYFSALLFCSLLKTFFPPVTSSPIPASWNAIHLLTSGLIKSLKMRRYLLLFRTSTLGLIFHLVLSQMSCNSIGAYFLSFVFGCKAHEGRNHVFYVVLSF